MTRHSGWFGEQFVYDELRTSLKASDEAIEICDRKMRDGMRKAKKEGKLILASSHGPWWEICPAMDMWVVDICHIGHMAASGGEASTIIDYAQQRGTSLDLCGKINFSYAYFHEGHRMRNPPFGGWPTPDMIIQTNSHCDEEVKAFENLSRELNIPMYTFDIPFNTTGGGYDDIEQNAVDYYVEETKNMITWLENQTGTKLDPNRLGEVLDLGERDGQLRKEIYNNRKSVPASMTSVDSLCTILVPNLLLRGTEEMIYILERTLEEVKERVAKKESAIPDEKYRLMGLPGLWVNPGIMSAFEDRGAVGIMEAWRQSTLWGMNFKHSKEHPFDDLARLEISSGINSAGAATFTAGKDTDSLAKQIDLFKIDGVVNTMGQTAHCSVHTRTSNAAEVKRVPIMITVDGTAVAPLMERPTVPAVTVNTDMVNDRFWNNLEIKEKIGAFISNLPPR